MASQHRLAVFNLSVSAAATVAFVALIPVLGAWRAQGAFALLALTAAGVFASRTRGGGVGWDERDRTFHLRSVQVGFAAVWLIVVGGVMGACTAYGFDGSVPSRLLTMGLYLTWVAFVVGQSATLLVLYRKA